MRGDAPPHVSTESPRCSTSSDSPGSSGATCRQLSGGEAKRVALARSLAPAPRVLLLDEPLTGLDRELHDRLAGDLAAILRAERTTSLLVTHDRDEAEAIADRVVMVDELVSQRRRDTSRQVTVEDDSTGCASRYCAATHRATTSTSPHDRDPETVHLAVRDESGAVIAASTWTPKPFPGPSRRAGRAAARHGGARRPPGARTRCGDRSPPALDDARRRGATLVWANARDSALEFYVANGFARGRRRIPHDRHRPTAPPHRPAAVIPRRAGAGARSTMTARWRVVTLRTRIAALSVTPRMPNTISGGSPRT